jgi:hypothetical protein
LHPYARFKAWLIRLAQRREGFLPKHSEWHHVAICEDGRNVIEAVPKKGIARTALTPEYAPYEIKIRTRPGISPSERRRVVAAALERHRAGLKYNYGLIARVVAEKYAARLGIFGKLLPGLCRMLARDGDICTTLCRHSYAAALGVDIFRARSDLRAIMPANISETSMLG